MINGITPRLMLMLMLSAGFSSFSHAENDSNDTAPPSSDTNVTDAEMLPEGSSDDEFVDIDDILYGVGSPSESADASKAEDPETLQAEIQNLKESVVQINRDLFILEEDLLFPSSTQINVFVSFDALAYFQMNAITLKVNDQPVSSHLYTERELQALNRGAVQRLYTGNLPVGDHELVAVVTGVGPENRDYKRAVNLEFKKNSGTMYFELKIEGDDLRQQPGFELKEWE